MRESLMYRICAGARGNSRPYRETGQCLVLACAVKRWRGAFEWVQAPLKKALGTGSVGCRTGRSAGFVPLRILPT
jgi:hypothetical protein